MKGVVSKIEKPLKKLGLKHVKEPKKLLDPCFRNVWRKEKFKSGVGPGRSTEARAVINKEIVSLQDKNDSVI